MNSTRVNRDNRGGKSKSPFPPVQIRKITTVKTKTILGTALACAVVLTTSRAQAAGSPYEFERGFPAAGTAELAYAAADFRRAVEAYKFFYLTLSTEAVMQQGQAVGARVNEVGIVMEYRFQTTTCRHNAFVANFSLHRNQRLEPKPTKSGIAGPGTKLRQPAKPANQPVPVLGQEFPINPVRRTELK
jgi:hypothetical protein